MPEKGKTTTISLGSRPPRPTTAAKAAVETKPAMIRAETPRPLRWGFLWLVIPALVASAGWWFGLRALLMPAATTHALTDTLWLSAAVVIAFAGLAGVTLLVPFFLNQHRWYPVVPILVTLPGTLLFQVTAPLGLAMLIMATGLWASSEGVGREGKSRLKIDVRSMLAHVMAWSVLGASLAVAVVQYDVSRLTIDPATNVAHLVDRSAKILETFGPRVYPGFSATVTVDELLGAQLPTVDQLLTTVPKSGAWTVKERTAIIDRLNSFGIDPGKVPTAGASMTSVRQALGQALKDSHDEAVAELRNGLSKQLGVTLRGDETVHQALVDILNARIVVRAGAFVKYLPPIVALGLFLALRILSPVFEILAVGVGWWWYLLLRFMRIIRIRTYAAEAEQLEWGNIH